MEWFFIINDYSHDFQSIYKDESKTIWKPFFLCPYIFFFKN